MEQVNPWRIPRKIKGQHLKPAAYNYDPNYLQAIKEFAQTESARQGRKISVATVHINLSTRNGKYFAAKRTELSNIYKAINEEHTNAHYFDIKKKSRPTTKHTNSNPSSSAS